MPLLVDSDFLSINVLHSIDIAESDTLGIAVAQIAFEDLTVNLVEVHGSERADCYAGTTSDARIIIYLNTSHFIVTGNGLHRADIHAWRILALLT